MHFLCSFVIAPLSICNAKHLNGRSQRVFLSVTDSMLEFLQQIRYKLCFWRRRDRKVMRIENVWMHFKAFICPAAELELTTWGPQNL